MSNNMVLKQEMCPINITEMLHPMGKPNKKIQLFQKVWHLMLVKVRVRSSGVFWHHFWHQMYGGFWHQISVTFPLQFSNTNWASTNSIQFWYQLWSQPMQDPQVKGSVPQDCPHLKPATMGHLGQLHFMQSTTNSGVPVNPLQVQQFPRSHRIHESILLRITGLL